MLDRNVSGLWSVQTAASQDDPTYCTPKKLEGPNLCKCHFLNNWIIRLMTMNGWLILFSQPQYHGEPHLVQPLYCCYSKLTFCKVDKFAFTVAAGQTPSSATEHDFPIYHYNIWIEVWVLLSECPCKSEIEKHTWYTVDGIILKIIIYDVCFISLLWHHTWSCFVVCSQTLFGGCLEHVKSYLDWLLSLWIKPCNCD